MSDCQFQNDVCFVFYVDLADSIGSRVEAERDQARIHGYAHGYGLVHEFEQDDCDVRLNIVVPPNSIDDFQRFMENVGIDPSYVICTDEKDAYHAQKCGWDSNLVNKCGNG